MFALRSLRLQTREDGSPRLFGRIRRTDWLPVGAATEDQQLQRSYDSLSDASEEGSVDEVDEHSETDDSDATSDIDYGAEDSDLEHDHVHSDAESDRPESDRSFDRGERVPCVDIDALFE